MEEVVHADKVYVMDNGEVVMQGTPREIFSQVETLKEYRLDVPQVTLLAHELHKAGKLKRGFTKIFLLETYVLQCFLCFYFCHFPG